MEDELNKLKRKLQNKIEDQEDQILASAGPKNRAFKEYNDAFDVLKI
jgi:hypothetical protein